MANSDSARSAVTHERESYTDDAKARRVFNIDSEGNNFDSHLGAPFSNGLTVCDNWFCKINNGVRIKC